MCTVPTRARRNVHLALALAVFTGASFAQYLPTPPPSEYIDDSGVNIGCIRAYGAKKCGGGNNAPHRAPPKPDVWGAIAVAPALDWGTAWNYSSEQAAQSEALRRCQLHAKPGTCKAAASVADVCIALVASKTENLWRVGGPTGALNIAEDNGKLQCKRAGGKACKVETSFCADGQRHELQGTTVYSNGNPIFVPQGQSETPVGRRR